MSAKIIAKELRSHAPYTALGTLSGIVIMAVIIWVQLPKDVSSTLFWTLHPLHVLLSALVTAAMYRLHSNGKLLSTIVIAYVGTIGPATVSDSIIPFVGEWMLHLPNRGLHLGFIEKWWLVNPLALIGITWGYVLP